MIAGGTHCAHTPFAICFHNAGEYTKIQKQMTLVVVVKALRVRWESATEFRNIDLEVQRKSWTELTLER